MADDLVTPQGRRIAYDRSPGDGPGIVFLGGFRSDMAGTKARHLEGWARARGQAFLRFDYSGHGESGGAFEDGAIGDWAEDAAAALGLTEGRQILVGSSMGGWIALLLARAMPERIAGLVTIAAAPDFTEDSMWAGFSEYQKAQLLDEGRVLLPSDYGEDYVITRRLIEDGRTRLVLRDPGLPAALLGAITFAFAATVATVAILALGVALQLAITCGLVAGGLVGAATFAGVILQARRTEIAEHNFLEAEALALSLRTARAPAENA